MKRGRLGEGGYVIPALLAISTMVFIFANVFIQMALWRAGQLTKNWSIYAAVESAENGFALMEAALRRRMWEVPPDSNCRRSTEFSVTGSFSGGGTITVTGYFDPATGNLKLVSTGNFRGIEMSLQKHSRIVDVSQYLVFSKATSDSRLIGVQGGDNGNFASGLVAGSRKLYFEGPVVLGGNLHRRSWMHADWATQTPFRPTEDINQVIQAERIFMLGGVRGEEMNWTMELANANNPDGVNYLVTQAFMNGILGTDRHFQIGFHAYLTGNLNHARSVLDAIRLSDVSLLPPNVNRQMYPRALFGFGGVRPLNAQLAADSGNYLSDPDFWANFQFLYGPNFASFFDATCYQDATVPVANRKHCSSSKDFPRGFAAWRTQANLDGVLLGPNEAPRIDFPKISWDNLQALEEEADACGLVVDASDSSSYSSSHEDCDISDFNMLERLRNDFSTNPCEDVLDLDMDSLDSKLSNFDSSDYADPANSGLLSRRVIYLKNRTQISQTAATGLWPSLASPIARNQLPIWIVAEKELLFKPHQTDLTSPLQVNPGVRRTSYFNDGVGAPPLAPLSMVVVSPEPVTLLTPTHVPRNFNMLAGSAPDRLMDLVNVGGINKLRPRRTIYTDYPTQELDGFKYGRREVKMSNIALITNATGAGYEAGFFPRGLWIEGDPGWHALTRGCWFDKPGDNLARFAHVRAPSLATHRGEELPPAHINEPSGWIPPSGSRFYRNDLGVDKIPYFHTPNVFSVQAGAGMSQNSFIDFTGLRVVSEFDSSTPSGKRDLNIPIYRREDYLLDRPASLNLFHTSDRRYIWIYDDPNPTADLWWQDDDNKLTVTESTPGGGRACDGTLIYRADYMTWPVNYPIWFYANRSSYDYGATSWIPYVSFRQHSPDASYRNLGALSTTKLPVTISKGLP